jgi:hypothetical protein
MRIWMTVLLLGCLAGLARADVAPSKGKCGCEVSNAGAGAGGVILAGGALALLRRRGRARRRG